MPQLSLAQLARKTRRQRADVALYAGLIAAPALLTTTLPAGGRFWIAAPAGRGAGLAVTVVGSTTRNLSSPALAANQRYCLGWFERNCVVTIQAGLDLYIDAGLGVLKRVVRSS